MEIMIPKLYKEYGIYTNKRKMLPSIIDGLLPVQRRILLTVHVIAKNKFIKTAKILGECMARWHPHSAAEGTAIWAVQNGFVDGDGQWGSNIGIEPESAAAPRYTSMKSNKYIEDIAFEYINYVKWEPDEADPEPIAIPTIVPFCLMSKYELSSIGFGFKTNIPCYDICDLVNRLLYLKGIINKVTIKPTIIGCNILSTDEECEEILTKGIGKISIQGKYEIDNENKCIIIYGWSPRQIFETLLNKIDKFENRNLLSNGDIGYVDESTGGYTKITFEIAKNRNKDNIFHDMKNIIPQVLKSQIGFSIYVIDGKEITISSVDKMLLSSYEFYKNTFETYLKTSIKDIECYLSELEIIKKIRPYISDITRDNGHIDDICKILEDRIKCNKEDINKIIDKYKIKKLISVSLDIDEYKKKLNELNKCLKHVDKLCISKYTNYSTTERI